MQDINPLRLGIKAILIFILANLAFAFFDPPVGSLTLYNRLVPGRLRFAFAGGPAVDASVGELDALFASHIISGPKQSNEFRVVLLGDSSVWGDLLSPSQTLSEQINQGNFACNGRRIVAYNLGYPHPFLIKDLLILDEAKKYQPDMVIWMITLDTLRPRGPNPFVVTNQSRIISLVQRYNIHYGVSGLNAGTSLWERTIIGQRSRLASLAALQEYGVYWAGMNYPVPDPAGYIPVKNDLDNATPFFMGYQANTDVSHFLFPLINSGYQIAGSIPLAVINEPMFISTGRNSDVGYNEFYPRWAYDAYRDIMSRDAHENGWRYYDLWNAIPQSLFMDTALHLSPKGQNVLAQLVAPVIMAACPSSP